MNKYSFVQIGFFVNGHDFDENTINDINPQVAARKLEGRYIDGFKKNNLYLTILSFFPATNFPRNRKIFFKYKSNVVNGVLNYSYPFINLIGIKHLTRFISCVVFLGIWHFKNRDPIKKIIIYSVHSPFVMAALIFKFLFNTAIFVIIPDLPSHMNFGARKNVIWNILKKIDSKFINFLVSRTSGISVVSKNMASENKKWGRLPYVVIEGMVDADSKIIEKNIVEKKIFLYTGGLNIEYGVQSLLFAFQDLFGLCENVELWLCGKGELVSDIEDLMTKYSNIKYYGYLNQPEINRLMSNVFCLINCRNPNDDFVKYSFPSKLLEYLVAGIPILTTKLPGVPSEYDEYLNYLDGSDSNSIVKGVIEILQQDSETLQKKADFGRNFVLVSKNQKIQISKFLDLIIDKDNKHV